MSSEDASFDIMRLTQLFSKTNQFNITQKDLDSLHDSELDFELFGLDYFDKNKLRECCALSLRILTQVVSS